MIVNSLDKDWLTYTDPYKVFISSSLSAACNFMIMKFGQWKFMKLWGLKAWNTFCNPRYYIRSNAQRKTSNAPCTLMTCLYHFVSNILVQYNDFQLLKPFWQATLSAYISCEFRLLSKSPTLFYWRSAQYFWQ